MPRESQLPSTAKKNIDVIARVEQRLMRKRSAVERLGEAVARFFGSLPFILAHALVLLGWILWNTGKLRPLKPFDPYPFPFLSLVISIEFILLTTFVLMNQKLQMRREEHWSHLHLQLSMLTEQEVTNNLKMLIQVCERLGLRDVARDNEIADLTRPTPVTAMAGELEKSRDPEVVAELREIGQEQVKKHLAPD